MAIQMGFPVYAKSGFKIQSNYLQFTCLPRDLAVLESNGSIERLSLDHVQDVLQLDRTVSGFYLPDLRVKVFKFSVNLRCLCWPD